VRGQEQEYGSGSGSGVWWRWDGLDLLKRSMSAGVTCCVPDIHCILLIVGRGGIRSSGFMSISFVVSLEVCQQTILRHILGQLTVEVHDRKC
jgi:hypothetical protein